MKQFSKNQEIRKQIRAEGLALWEVAQEIGIGEVTLVRWLRNELDGDRLVKVKTAVDKLIKQGSTGND